MAKPASCMQRMHQIVADIAAVAKAMVEGVTFDTKAVVKEAGSSAAVDKFTEALADEVVFVEALGSNMSLRAVSVALRGLC